jgi:F-type H+-transporting ATPase subunit b
MKGRNILSRYRLYLVRLTVLVLMLGCYVPLVFAMEEGGEGHGEDWKAWIWRVLNFVILLVILIKFLGKPMRAYFQKRTEIIEESLRQAKEARELAEKALKEVQERISLKDEEIQKIMEASKQSGESEKELLIKQGHEMSEKIREQAKSNIAMELENARAALREEAAELAVRLAEKKIREGLTEEDQKRLVDESIRKLEE